MNNNFLSGWVDYITKSLFIEYLNQTFIVSRKQIIYLTHNFLNM